MRNKAFDDYSPEYLGKLRHILVDIYSAFGGISENLYLVGGLVPDLLVKNKLSYLREYLGTLDINLAAKRKRGRFYFYRYMTGVLRDCLNWRF